MCLETQEPPCVFIYFALLRKLWSSSKKLWWYPRPLSKYTSHSITVWSSPHLISQSFSLRKPTRAGTAALPVITGNRKREERVYLCCIEPAGAHSNCSLVWDWKRRACGTPSSANAIFKEILHNSSFFFLLSFWWAILKVSLADPFNFDEPVKPECKILTAWLGNFSRDGVDIGMIMRHSFQKNEWINNQSSVWEE